MVIVCEKRTGNQTQQTGVERYTSILNVERQTCNVDTMGSTPTNDILDLNIDRYQIPPVDLFPCLKKWNVILQAIGDDEETKHLFFNLEEKL